MTALARPRLLAISGSLRAASVNTALLRAAQVVCTDLTEIVLYEGVGQLPWFNPDDDVQPAHVAVLNWRKLLLAAEGIIVACPEYAHGVPGALKNALDWVVGSGEMVDKPLAQWNAAPRASLAQAALRETLEVMSLRRIEAASTVFPITIKNITTEQILADAALCELMHQAVASLVAARIEE